MAAPHATRPVSIPQPVPKLLRDLIHERIGIYFEPDRFDTLLEKVHDRVAARGCRSLLDYYYLLRYDANNEEEWHRVMDAFSVQETYFWREIDQIRALVDVIVPAWFRTHADPLRIWSAACASGEEPYTIAIALQEAGWGSHPIEVWGSDASDAALVRARAAVYRERSFRSLPLDLRHKYFRPVAGGFELIPAISSRVRFRWANLISPADTDDLAAAPVIFCRNVFIYFSPQAIARVVSRFAQHMPAGGHLFVGASESLLKLTNEFDLTELQNAFVYCKKAPSA